MTRMDWNIGASVLKQFALQADEISNFPAPSIEWNSILKSDVDTVLAVCYSEDKFRHAVH